MLCIVKDNSVSMILLRCFLFLSQCICVMQFWTVFEQCLYTFYLMSMIQKSRLQRQTRVKPKSGAKRCAELQKTACNV